MADTPTNIKDQLKRDEGFRSKLYTDSVGAPTVGYGFNLRDEGLTEEEASYVLESKLATLGSELDSVLPWAAKQLDYARYCVLINMAYNLGVPGLLEFNQTLALVQAGSYDLAAEEMLQSVWATQVGARAERLALQMKTGVWQ